MRSPLSSAARNWGSTDSNAVSKACLRQFPRPNPYHLRRNALQSICQEPEVIVFGNDDQRFFLRSMPDLGVWSMVQAQVKT